MPRVRLSPFASVTPTDRGVLLRSDLGTFEIGGADVRAFIEAILPLLDGSRDRDEVAGALEEFSPRSVLAVLDLLQEKGLLEAAPVLEAPLHERWRGQGAFFRKWSRAPEEMARKLSEARVLLAGLSPWGAAAAGELAGAGAGRIDIIAGEEANELGASKGREALSKALGEASPWCRVTVTPLAWRSDGELDVESGRPRPEPGIADGGRDRFHLVIGAAPGHDVRLLRSLARFAHTTDAVSLFGDLDGTSGRIGPVVVPGKTACWSCAEGLRGEDAHAGRRGPSSTMASLLGHLLALEAIKLLTGYADSELTGRILVQDFDSLETTILTATRAPRCPVCGPGNERAPRAG